MSRIKDFLKTIGLNGVGRSHKFSGDDFHNAALSLNMKEVEKTPSRTTVINFILGRKNGATSYLEIGVRNPADNFDKIKADFKYSVDPGLEYSENPADFKLTSNEFFNQLEASEIALKVEKFDVVFIDGLHDAIQVDSDIRNALRFLKQDGFIILHDCNPPTEWHARETFEYSLSPAGQAWNGSVWKAFTKWRRNPSVTACCIDTDWGVGVISQSVRLGSGLVRVNEYYEYQEFAKHRVEYLNLISFEDFQALLV